jgi:hypothetical protein
MKMHQSLGIAIFCGALGMLGGQDVQAQPNDPTPFVQLLLSRETRGINLVSTAIARQDREIQALNLLETQTLTPRVQRTIAQLTIAIDRLQNIINVKTFNLRGLNGELNATLLGLPTPNQFTGLAASNAAIITALSNRLPFGIVPASSFQ